MKNVVVNQMAVSNQQGTVILYGDSATGSIKGNKAGDIIVPATYLDTYWEQHGTPHIHIIKIGVEGTEDFVVQGMQRLLAAEKSEISLEVHLFQLSKEEIAAMLIPLIETHGYKASLIFLLT